MNSLRFCSRQAAARLLLPFLLSACLMMGCEKDNNPNEPQPPRPGLVTDVGSPLGNAVTATIGPEGGTLVSEDGLLSLNIPAGALAQPTNISVQSISAEAPLAVGGAYRLLPHGQQFSLPVTLSFAYAQEQLSDKTGQALGIAYQDDEGIWQAMPGVTVQTATHTATLATTHFSDWSLYEAYAMMPTEAHLNLSESINLRVIYMGDLIAPLVPTPLPMPSELKAEQVGPWLVNDKAALPSGGPDGALIDLGANANYTAPSSMPTRNPVAVSAEVDVPGRSKLLLVSTITIGGTYVTINGGPFANATFQALYPGYAVHANGYNSVYYVGTDGEENLMGVTVFFPGSSEGSFTWVANESCGVVMNTAGDNTNISINHVKVSEPPQAHPGTVQIEQFGEVGEAIMGSFSGTVTIVDMSCTEPCIYTGTASGAFQVTRDH